MSRPSIPCGEERFQTWRKTLFVNADASDEVEKGEYFRIRAFLAEKLANVSRVSAGSDGEIMRDVIRTFQKQKFFQRYQPGQRMLLHILFALVAARPDVGYCQGMNYVVAALLLGRIPASYTNITEINAVLDEAAAVSTEDDEDGSGNGSGSTEVALALVKAAAEAETMSVEMMDAVEADVFLAMMEMLRPDSKLDMAGMWKERIPKLKLRIYQLDRLLRWTYPQLHAHFTAIELSPEVITAQWFLTLFTYTFPVVPTVLELWDYIFLTGWEGMFKVALSLLGSLQPKLLQLDDFESIVMLMREWKREGKLIIDEPVDALLARADKFVINKEVLDRLQESFASEILSIALIRSQVLNNERESQQAQGQGQGQNPGQSAGQSQPSSSGSSSPLPIRAGISAALQSLGARGISSSTVAARKVTPVEDSTATDSIGGSGGDPGNVNSALASLSSAERRKVIQKQQQQEAEIEEQLLSGAEAPVFWLLRYGAKLPDKVLQELRRIKVDLIALDHQVDVDKQLIQAKIIKACELNRETLEEVAAAELALHEASQTVEQGRASLQAALVLARQVALEVVELMEGPTPELTTQMSTSPQHSPKTAASTKKASPGNSRSNSGATPTASLASLTEQVASFGSYQNRGFPRVSGAGSRGNSRTNSADLAHSGDNNTSKGSISSGMRFPTMPWSSSSRKEKSGKISSSDNAATSIVSSSPVAKAEMDTIRDFVYDADAGKQDQIFSGNDAFIGEGAELARPRSFAVDKDGVLPTEVIQESEFDDVERFRERMNISCEDSDLVDEFMMVKSPDIPISGGSSSPRPQQAPVVTGVPSEKGTAITSSGGNSGGVLSTFSSTGWNFPVVRALHHITGTKSCVPSHNVPRPEASAGSSSAAASGQASSGGAGSSMISAGGGGGSVTGKGSGSRSHTKQMKALEKRGQWVQQQIIDIDRALEESRRDLEFARRRLESARINNEETTLWKNSLCDQLHLLVRDSNRGRSQKLMYVAENYNI